MLKYYIFILLFLLGAKPVCLANSLVRAYELSNQKEYSSAANLFLEAYQTSSSTLVLEQYIKCVIAGKLFNVGVQNLKLLINKNDANKLLCYLYCWGLDSAQGKPDKKAHYLKLALNHKNLSAPKINELLNSLINTQLWPQAQAVLSFGIKRFGAQAFNKAQLALYKHQKQHTAMLGLYLNLLQTKQVTSNEVVNELQQLLSSQLLDSASLKTLKTTVTAAVYKYPEVSQAFSAVLMAILEHQGNYSAILQQYIALNNKYGTETKNLLEFAENSLKNNRLELANKAYSYLLNTNVSKSENYEYITFAQLNSAFLLLNKSDLNAANKLFTEYNTAFNRFGYTANQFTAALNKAQLMAFTQDNADSAIQFLESLQKLAGLTNAQKASALTLQADCYVLNNNQLEAILLYNKVVKQVPNSAEADEAKLKQAQLAYYSNDFAWANAQLSVLNAASSKLVANDALALHTLINCGLENEADSAILITLAKADAYLFKHKPDSALSLLNNLPNEPDSLSEITNYVLFKKAQASIARQNITDAIESLKLFSHKQQSVWFDDAMCVLIQLSLRQQNQAEAVYYSNKLLADAPNSWFANYARGVLTPNQNSENYSVIEYY